MSGFEDPELRAWEKSVRRDLIPKLESSGAVVSLVPSGETDVKFAVELGLSIMMDKPILAVAQPDTEIPPKLNRVADLVIVADMGTPEGQAHVQQAIHDFLED